MASSDLNNSTMVGDKIVRTEDGVYLTMAGAAPVKQAMDDDAMTLPIGTKISVYQTSPLRMEVAVRIGVPGHDPIRNPSETTVLTTNQTSVGTILAGLVAFRTAYQTPA